MVQAVRNNALYLFMLDLIRLVLRIVQITNTANSKYVLFDGTLTADTWERKSVTFSGNTANTLNNDNALWF